MESQDHQEARPAKRAYRQGRRAEATGRTRERILATALEMHLGVGPRATTVSEVARRAGVDRLTVYNHFPDEAALALAVQERWRELHPWPATDGLGDVEDPEERLRLALEGLWGWYAATRGMTAHLLRDGPAMPALAPVLGGMAAAREALADLLLPGRRPGPMLRPTLRVVLSFPTWESLLGEGRMAPEAGVALVEGWVQAAERG